MQRTYIYSLWDTNEVRHDFTEVLPFPANSAEEDATLLRLKATCGFVVTDKTLAKFRSIGSPFDN
jgi:hypothetical protein